MITIPHRFPVKLRSLRPFQIFSPSYPARPTTPTKPIVERSSPSDIALLRQHPVLSSTDATTNELLNALHSGHNLAFYYFGGQQPRRLRIVTVLSVFKIDHSPHTFISAFCNVRNKKRTFRIDRVSLA